MASKWVCGFDFSDKLIIAEVQGRETEKMFIIDKDHDGGKSYRDVGRALGHASRLSKDDTRLHASMEDALQARLIVETGQQKMHLRVAGEHADRADRLRAMLGEGLKRGDA